MSILPLPVNAAGAVPRYAKPFIQEMERRGYAIKEMDDSLTKETKKGPYRDVAFKLVKGDQTLVRELQLLQTHMLAAKAEMHDFYDVQQRVQLALKNPNLPDDGREYLSVVMEWVMAEQKMAYTDAYRLDNPGAGLWSVPSNALNTAPMPASRIADSSSQVPSSPRSDLSSSKVRPVMESAPTSSSDIAKTSSREKTSRAMGDTSTGIVPQESAEG